VSTLLSLILSHPSLHCPCCSHDRVQMALHGLFTRLYPNVYTLPLRADAVTVTATEGKSAMWGGLLSPDQVRAFGALVLLSLRPVSSRHCRLVQADRFLPSVPPFARLSISSCCSLLSAAGQITRRNKSIASFNRGLAVTYSQLLRTLIDTLKHVSRRCVALDWRL
jgi:hypothetical protein